MKIYLLLSGLVLTCSLVAMKKDPHQVYLQRYPKLRATYEKCSNEHDLFLNTMRTVVKKIKEHHPDFYKNGIQLFTIGCRRGHLSKAAIEIFKKQGISNISFRGIDRFKKHVQQAKATIKEGTVIHDNFETYQLSEKDKQYANFILALQVCHHIKKIDEFVQKLQRIAQQDAVVLFAHTDDSQMSWFIKQIISKYQSQHTTKDVCTQLDASLNKYNAIVCKSSEKPTLKAPSIIPEIKQLEKVQYEDYENEYKEHSESFHTIKDLIELGLDTPLESFGNWTKNWTLLPALKKNFKPENQLPLTTHIVTLNGASDKLKTALKK